VNVLVALAQKFMVRCQMSIRLTGGVNQVDR